MKILRQIISWSILICWTFAPVLALARPNTDDVVILPPGVEPPLGGDLPLPSLVEPPLVVVPPLAGPFEPPSPLFACDPPAPIVTVKVSVPACADADKNLVYRILVKNWSPAPAHRVIVKDQLPANARFVQASPKPHAAEPELQWHLGTLKGYGCQEITLILFPTNGQDVSNCVRVQFEHGICVRTRRTGLPPPQLIVPGEGPMPRPGAKLDVKVKGPGEHPIQKPARYFITVANVGTGPAMEAAVESVLPKKLTFVRASGKGMFSDDRVTWPLGDIPANESRTVELVVQAAEAGKFCLSTRAHYNPEQKTLATQTCTNFVSLGALLLEMYDRQDPIPVLGKTSYPIIVLNQGPVPVTNIRVEAEVPPGMQLVEVRGPHQVKGKTVIFEPLATLAPGAQIEYEVFTRALTPGDLRFKVQMQADQIKEAGPIHEEESTTVYSEDAPAQQVLGPQRPRRQVTVNAR